MEPRHEFDTTNAEDLLMHMAGHSDYRFFLYYAGTKDEERNGLNLGIEYPDGSRYSTYIGDYFTKLMRDITDPPKRKNGFSDYLRRANDACLRWEKGKKEKELSEKK